MIPAIVLLAWMAVGAVIAVATTPPDDPRHAWVPMAVFLGPFWAVIARERGAPAVDRVPIPAPSSGPS